MCKRRFSALFLTLALLFCTLPAAAEEGDGWLVPKVREAPPLRIWPASGVRMPWIRSARPD